MRRMRFTLFAVPVVALVLVAAPARGSGTTIGKTLIERWNGSKWVRVSSPSPSGGDALFSVDAANGANAWAVGVHGSGPSSHPLIEHWNGSKWTVVTGPHTPGGTQLNGVSARTPSDVWAVGLGANDKPLIEHWDGSHWTIVPDDTAVSSGELNAVDALAVDDVIAVGDSNGKTLVEQWDNVEWLKLKSPSATGQNSLDGVHMISATNVWAVGTSSESSPHSKTLTEHWGGSSTNWTIANSPSPGMQSSLDAVTAKGSQAFAAGSYLNSQGCLRTLALRRTSSSWKQMTTQNPFQCDNSFDGIAASTHGVFAVGNYPKQCGTNCFKGVTLVERFVNGAWKLVASPNSSLKFNSLAAVAWVPGKNQAWAVGVATNIPGG